VFIDRGEGSPPLSRVCWTWTDGPTSYSAACGSDRHQIVPRAEYKTDDDRISSLFLCAWFSCALCFSAGGGGELLILRLFWKVGFFLLKEHVLIT
jgi:hypothetical protein